MLQSLDRVIDHMADGIATLLHTPSCSPSPDDRKQYKHKHHPRPQRFDKPIPLRPPPPLPPRPNGPMTIPLTSSAISPRPGRHQFFRKPFRNPRKTVRWGTITEIPARGPMFHFPRPRPRAKVYVPTANSRSYRSNPYFRHPDNFDGSSREYIDGDWVHSVQVYLTLKLKSIMKPPSALDEEMLYQNLWAMNLLSERRLEHTYEFLGGVLVVGDDVLDSILKTGELLMYEEAGRRAVEMGGRRARGERGREDLGRRA